MTKQHARVSAQGKSLGNSSAIMAELGRKRLESAGLTGLNLPGARDDMCASCATRKDSVPNGCIQTQLDFMKCVVDGKPFLCHAPKDGRMCAGFVFVRAQHVANPMPKEVVSLLAKHEYSPPDES